MYMQGLSLDYISEVCRKSPHSSRIDLALLTAEEALAAKEKEIKLDIVARFNAAQHPSKYLLPCFNFITKYTSMLCTTFVTMC